ncbi:hypothetical protein BDY21DRAFT_363061 [Lineolata rhizophorae]|uniref:Uncharacterized protein n=1 Tax=Lineolata rhizophorae TaxID=578093 RepID=A0A6A6P2L1_9PEZI|nr:hypothetical protein BDY21DRAFT_363061 [Lineolata rhizophorae]
MWWLVVGRFLCWTAARGAAAGREDPAIQHRASLRSPGFKPYREQRWDQLLGRGGGENEADIGPPPSLLSAWGRAARERALAPLPSTIVSASAAPLQQHWAPGPPATFSFSWPAISSRQPPRGPDVTKTARAFVPVWPRAAPAVGGKGARARASCACERPWHVAPRETGGLRSNPRPFLPARNAKLAAAREPAPAPNACVSDGTKPAAAAARPPPARAKAKAGKWKAPRAIVERRREWRICSLLVPARFWNARFWGTANARAGGED